MSTFRSRRPWRRTISGQISPASAICCSSGAGSPLNGTASTPSAAASRGHSRRQRKTSPLTMLSAWFAAAGRRRGPHQVVGQQARVRDVGDRLPLLARAREAEPAAGLAADRRVDGERHAHVHRVAERPADQGVRPVHGPREPVALRGGEEDVLLHVVEVLVRAGAAAPRRTACPAAPSRTPRTARDSASAR